MQGIEILNSKEVVIKEKFNWKWFGISNILTWITVAISGILIIATSPNIKDPAVTVVSLIIFGFIYGLFFGGITGSLRAIPILLRTEYKAALLDESVISKLEEKYEIINRDGKLLTIREKG